MPELARYPKGTSRTLIDYQAVIDGLGENDVILCVDEMVVNIIRKLLRDRGLWRTTYVLEYGEIGYTKPTQEEFEPIRAAIAAFLEDTNQMNCNDFLAALNAIAAAIGNCCAAGGAGAYLELDGGIYPGSQQPEAPPTSFGPGEEFETETAYNAHRCASANRIVEGLIFSLNNWSILSFASITAGGLVVAFFVATPPLAVFIALAAAGLAFGALHTMANYIDDNREEWVCAIYNGDGFLDTLTAVDSLVASMLTDLSLEAFSEPVTDLFHEMLNTNVINGLYTAVGLPEPIGTDISCDLCNPCLLANVAVPLFEENPVCDVISDTGGDPRTMRLESNGTNGWRVALTFDTETGCLFSVTSAVDLIGTANDVTVEWTRADGDNDVDIVNGSAGLPAFLVSLGPIRRVDIIYNLPGVPWQFELTITDEN